MEKTSTCNSQIYFQYSNNLFTVSYPHLLGASLLITSLSSTVIVLAAGGEQSAPNSGGRFDPEAGT
jgi:hypothetical protein